MPETDVREHYERFPDRDWASSMDVPDGFEPVRFALLGLGSFTRDRVVSAIRESALATTTCLVSGSVEKAERVAEDADADADHALTYEEFHDGAAAAAYDAVYVCTPNALTSRPSKPPPTWGRRCSARSRWPPRSMGHGRSSRPARPLGCR